jgi:hypothetical protein
VRALEKEVAMKTSEEPTREAYQRPRLVRHEPLLRVTGQPGLSLGE